MTNNEHHHQPIIKHQQCIDYGILAIGGVVFLVTFIPLTSQLFIFWPWLSFRSQRDAVWCLAPFNLAVLSIWVNYYLACTQTPVKSPQDYNSPQHTHDTKPAVKELKKTTGKPRWCKTCEVYKPPRSHHCRECNRCVLKMDHHCPWLNNCVGHRNLGHFLRFLLSVTFAVIYALALIGFRMWDLISNQEHYGSHYTPYAGYHYTPPANNAELLSMVFNLVLLFILLFTVGILSIWQLYFVTCNTTTIENSENSKIQDLIAKNKVSADITFPYDLGTYRNLQAVLGSHVLLWWLPQPAEGDGLSFDIDPELLDSGEDIIWPPSSTMSIKRGERGYRNLISRGSMFVVEVKGILSRNGRWRNGNGWFRMRRDGPLRVGVVRGGE
ncbi:DHHC palmitoyltransferase-domain-containing protein [Chytridium lagenaria]|nr:DHHC palmitoyltransferase-domain-containing protein [Chytridium lagenaria]